MRKIGITWIITLIICLAFFLRVYKVSVNPPSISWDEASIGYNAYAILTAGRDEHGKFLPLDTFAAFGDYKPPVPIYLTVPFIALFGLSEFAVRLPSVFAGTLTVFVLYFLMRELFYKHKRVLWLAFVGAGLLAISPWHIMLSRGGFEANIALFWVTSGAWLLLLSRRIPTLLYIWGLPFVLGIYTFNSTRYAGPLIALGAIVFIRQTVVAHKKKFLVGGLIATLALLPILPHLVSKESRLRFAEVSIFTDLRTVLTSNDRRLADGNGVVSGLVHNRRIGYAREFLLHFADHFDPRYLFVSGDGNPKFSIRDTGQLLLVSAPFIAIGGFALVHQFPAIFLFLMWWMMVSVLPAAVARETPHALRTENALPIWLMLSSFGVVSFIDSITKKRQMLIGFIVVVFFFFNFAYFWHNLMNHYPKEYSGEWQYGYKNAIQLAKKLEKNYDTIVLTESIGRPYIYALFYTQYDVTKFLSIRDGSFDAAGFYNVYGFDKFRFTREGVSDYKGKVLYILPPSLVPDGASIVETIGLLNGKPVLVAFE